MGFPEREHVTVADLGGKSESIISYYYLVGHRSGMDVKGVAFGSTLCMEFR